MGLMWGNGDSLRVRESAMDVTILEHRQNGPMNMHKNGSAATPFLTCL